MRPGEIASLKRADCSLPPDSAETADQWGELVLGESRPEVGGGWTNDGASYEARALKRRSRGATRLVPGSLDFLPGPGPRTLDLGSWGKAGIQVCYEIVFSGQVVDRAHRPDYIFNPSNDGWFGSFGPPQHLAQARLRAIEEGLPVLRATTTGISAVIDAQGIVRDYVPMHEARRMDGLVPPALPPTLFARLGNALALGWAGLLLLAAILLRLRAGKRV